MQAHQIKIQKTAHYYTIGEAGQHIKRLWICCHGYGQAAGKFIYKFEEIDDGETFVVAPEGLSRFYFGRGVTGSIGASWMTSGDRLIEIDDYCNWLDTIYDLFVPQMSDDVEITFLGFSQGVATVFRWMHARQKPCQNIVVWAGRVPEDINYQPFSNYFQSKKMITIYGTNDQFMTPEFLEKERIFLSEQPFNFEEMSFEGKHVVHRPTLKIVQQKLFTT